MGRNREFEDAPEILVILFLRFDFELDHLGLDHLQTSWLGFQPLELFHQDQADGDRSNLPASKERVTLLYCCTICSATRSTTLVFFKL